jgi:hypothetical protein
MCKQFLSRQWNYCFAASFKRFGRLGVLKIVLAFLSVLSQPLVYFGMAAIGFIRKKEKDALMNQDKSVLEDLQVRRKEIASLLVLLPSADYKVVCRRPWNHFLTPLPPRLY